MTTRRLPVVFTRRAEKEIERANAWWRANRSGASDAIWEELVDAVDLVSAQPSAGTPGLALRLKGVRRLLLRRVGYFLYYRVARRPREIQVLSFWHARRGSGPAL